MKQVPSNAYLEKAKKLSREEAEYILSRMRRKLQRRMEDKETTPLEAVAVQLQKEDEDLLEWRERWSEIKSRDGKKKEK